MATIFVKASEAVSDECITEAANWFDEPNQKMFSDTRSLATIAVAEYLANKKGFTLYDCNATYPKAKNDE